MSRDGEKSPLESATKSRAELTRDSRDRNRQTSRGAKVVLVLIGVAIGLVISEIVVFAYFEWVIWLPFHNPPAYERDAAHVRMAVLGGSTSKGSPYNGALREIRFPHEYTLLSMTQFFLKRRYGYANVQTDCYADGGWPIKDSVDYYWNRAKYKPDVIVLYTGHNEIDSYYSLNMEPPHPMFSPLAATNTGALLLRYLFMRQARPGDARYHGKFFSENRLPDFEADWNRNRFRRYVELVIQHCRDEDIVLILVIPEGNYLYPPTRSVYDGPAERKAEALRLFKQAIYHKHFERDNAKAREILQELAGFCEFADLYFELGELYYRQGDLETAAEFLTRARALDELPTVVPASYRELLVDLAREHEVASIDMKTVIAEKLGAAIPDYSCFVDNCHFTPEGYEALAREIIRVLRERGFDRLDLPARELAISQAEREQHLGLTDQLVRRAIARANKRVSSPGESFITIRRQENALRIYRQLQAGDLTQPIEGDIRQLEQAMEAERARLLEWIRTDNEL